MAKKYDFSGWATWNDALCADGRVIKHNAFKDNDGAIVPLVYMHGHKSPEDIIGNVLLENRDQGVYCYGSFNNNPQALAAREAVMHGDIDHLSIYANHLQHQNRNEVIHGDIKEVSLVISGANPGAVIDYIDLAHDEEGESSAIIYTDFVLSNASGEINVTISHADEGGSDSSETASNETANDSKDDSKDESKDENAESKEETKESKDENEEDKEDSDNSIKGIYNNLSYEKKAAIDTAIEMAVGQEISHADMSEEELADIFDKFTADEMDVAEYLIGQAVNNSEVSHADDEEDTDESDKKEDAKAIWNSLNKDQKDAVGVIVKLLVSDEEDLRELNKELEGSEEAEHSDIDEESNEELEHSDKTLKGIWDSLSDKQRKVALLVIAETVARVNENDKVKHSDEGGNDMARNLFENGVEEQENVLTHDDMMAVLADIKTAGSLRNSVLQHGITNLEVMFPDDKYANDGSPIMVQRDQEWVSTVLNGVSKSPFARIKCMYADITGDEARAKGFLGSPVLHKDANGKPFRDSKGNLVDRNGNRVYKEEEIIPLMKRNVSPVTIYKKQRLDRNDIIDITDFDIVVWLKAEMKVMLNEEVARAIMIGDGRATSSPDKIDENNIKPIWTDADFYTIKAPVTVEQTDTDDTIAAKLIDMAVLAKKDYKGSGNTVLYINEDFHTRMLLLKDTLGHRLYGTDAELASAMRVSKIVPVPVFQGATRVDADEKTRTLVGLIVNLNDYRVGTDRKGAVTMFDDFDIDYNQEKYLIETRMSGMLIKPKSAIALETVPAGNG